MHTLKTATCALAVVLLSGITANAQKFPSVTWRNIQANLAPLPVIGDIKHTPSTIDMESFWSVGSETLDRDFADFEKYKKFLGETGVGYARFQSGWAKTEQKKGKYDFAWFDAHIDGCREQGVKPWVCLCYGNPVYSEHGSDLKAEVFPDGPVMDGWLNYVKAVVKRYKGKVSMYEVWNEPDGNRNPKAYELYANLFVRTAKAIKEIDPDVKITAFGCGAPDNKYVYNTLPIIKEKGGLDLMDYITFHDYLPRPESDVQATLKLREFVHSLSPKIELLEGEIGCPAQLEYRHALSHIEWTEYSQAKWDCRSMLTHFSLGIPHSVFTMVDLNYGWMQQSFGLIRTNLKGEPQYKRPKFYMVQNVTGIFTPAVKAIPVELSVSTNREITSFGVEKNGKPVGFALWFSDSVPTSSLERELVSIKETSFPIKHPVYVDLITGKIHELDSAHAINAWRSAYCDLSGIPIWDAPILIIDKAAL